LATGAGAESRAQIGMVIVGGMTFGTLFTLFVLPAVYTLVSRPRHLIAEDAAAAPAGEAVPHRAEAQLSRSAHP
jgi:multidrug efflux pump